MTKSIDSLVDDIYGLFSKTDWTPDPERVEAFGKRLATHIANRASETRGKPSLRLSQLGQPDRKLWYSINTPDDGEKLSPEARIKFLFGDILEELLLWLAAEAGHKVEGTQDTIEISGVKGHRDAIIDGRIVDVKSASSYSFKKFQNNGLRSEDPFGYLDQLGSYLYGSRNDPLVVDGDVGSFLVIDKQLGKITLDTYPRSDVDYTKVVEHKRRVLDLPEPPEQHCYEDEPDGKSGNRKLGVQCSYCPFKWKCWPGLRGFAYSNGPVYLTDVARLPKVPEFNSRGEEVIHF